MDKWYAVENDLIGGWDVANVDKPTGAQDYDEGEYAVAWGLSYEVAKRLAYLLNEFGLDPDSLPSS